MSRRGPRLVAGAAVALAAAALALAPATTATAHDYLVSSTPAPGSTVTAAPSTVSLTFDAAVLQLGRGSDGVIVTGPDGGARHFETGCVTVTNDTVTAPVALGAAGRYTVAWRIVSADGHPVSDSIAFTYRPAADAAAAAGSATGPDCGVAVTTGSHFGAPGDTGGDAGLAGLVVGVAVGVTVLVVAALVVAVVVLRRGRTADTEEPDD